MLSTELKAWLESGVTSKLIREFRERAENRERQAEDKQLCEALDVSELPKDDAELRRLLLRLVADLKAEKAHREKLFPKGVPKAPDIVDMACRLDSAKGTGRKKIDIAREFTGERKGDDSKAQKLLKRLRAMKARGEYNP